MASEAKSKVPYRDFFSKRMNELIKPPFNLTSRDATKEIANEWREKKDQQNLQTQEIQPKEQQTQEEIQYKQMAITDYFKQQKLTRTNTEFKGLFTGSIRY